MQHLVWDWLLNQGKELRAPPRQRVKLTMACGSEHIALTWNWRIVMTVTWLSETVFLGGQRWCVQAQRGTLLQLANRSEKNVCVCICDKC